MNVYLAIYAIDGGQFIRFVMCQEYVANMQVGQGEIAINADGKTYDDFELTYYDSQTNTVVDMPPKPGEWYRFDYQLKQWVVDRYSADLEAKKTRQLLLQQSDWTDTASAPTRLGQELYDQWQTYRQALRDITKQAEYPLNITWPIAPT